MTPTQQIVDELVRDLTTAHPLSKSEVRQRIASLIEAAKREEREKSDEILSALEDMYEQYCNDGHQFMSAGEHAQIVIQRYGTLNSALDTRDSCCHKCYEIRNGGCIFPECECHAGVLALKETTP